MSIDKENLEFHYNNYIYPKPVEDINEEVIKIGKVPYADPNFSWHILWPEKKYTNKGLNILIAGCGSDQAAILSKCNKNHNFIGIDLSKNSILHQEKLIKKHNIKNLELICNDFRKVKFKNKFDYIISTGVIHHLIDPESGLKYFYDNLKDNGVINLMVYGNKTSQSLNEVKESFKFLDLSQDEKSIKIVKDLVNSLNPEHPAKIFTKNLEDMKSNAGIVDLLLHKQEKFYSIKNLIELLDKNNLIIKNFFDGKIPSVTKFFLHNKNELNKIRQLSVNKKLEMGQILNWQDRKIELILSKKKELSNSKVYNKTSIMNTFVYPNRALKYNIENNSIEIEELFSKNRYKYKFPNHITIEWKKLLSGQFKLKDSFENLNSDDLLIINSIFEIMIENYHLDISNFSIGKYINHFAK